MNILTKEIYEEILNKEEEMLISIYFPTYKMGPDIKQNSIRLKQRIREAEDKLYNMKWKKADVENFLKPVSDLVDESKFWQNQTEGLAVFLSSEKMDYYHLPYEVSEYTVISNKYYTKPLIPLFTGDGEYYILALSQNEVRLFRANKQKINEIPMKDAPKNVDAMKVDQDSRTKLQIKTANPVSPTALVYNKNTQGQAVENDFDVNQLNRYFRAIDESLDKYKKKENLPLILAGVEYLIPIFKEISKYPNIGDEYIKGNPEILYAEDLHKNSWEIMEPKFIQIQELAEANYNQYKGQKNKLYANSLESIIPKAYNGQVETLFIDKDADKWGVHDLEKNKVKIYNKEKFEAEDLIGYASALTTTRGGKVYAVDSERVPGGGEVAAVLRY